jgi:hypothetical protein
MVKIRRVLVVLIAALPVTVVAGATQATAGESSYQSSGAHQVMLVGPNEGTRANERYPEGSPAF